MEQGFEFPRDLERLVHDRLFSARRAAQRLRFRPGVAVSSSSPIDVQRQQRRKKTLARALHCLREDYGTSLEMSQEALAYTNSLEDALCFLALQYTSDELPPKLRAQPVDGHKTVDAATGHLVVEKHEHKARARQFAIAWDDGNMKAIQANETQETTPQHAQALSWTHEYVRAQEEEQETAADDTGHVLAQRGRNGAVKTKTETVACSSGPLDQDTIVETHARKEEADAGDTGELDSDDGVCGLLEEAEATVVSADEMKQRAGLDPAARIAAHAVAALKANKGAKRRTKQRDQVPAAAASTHAAPAWTGPTPRELLAQHCRQQGRAKPQYKKLPRAAASSGHLYSVTIGTKRGSAATFQVTPEADDAMHGFETIGDAKDRVATMALYDVASHLPLYLVLPPVYRAMWLEWLQEREEREANVAQAHADQQEKLVEDIFHALPRELATKKVDVEPPPIGEQRASSTGIEGAPLTDKALLTQCNVDDWDEVSDDDTHRVEESPDEEAVASTEQQDESDVRAALELSRELRAQLQNQMRTRAYHVQLKQRALLPIASWKQRILEMVSTHDVMLISGETGCGKSTQVPHFVLEDVLLSEPGGARGCIVCAQPRRLAATSLAAQVSKELGEQRMGTPESLVGYQIRLEARMTRRTRLLFCTTGILLQKLQDPSTFSKDVSHVIVDEVHERDLQSDVVLALLRQLLAERDAHQQHGGGSLPSFKVILMSATLNAASFQTYFGGDALCPRIDVRGRTFPVDHYYLEDVLERTNFMVDETLDDSRFEPQESMQVTISGRGGSSSTHRVSWTTATCPTTSHAPQSPRAATYRESTLRALHRLDPSVVNYALIQALVEHLVTDTELLSSKRSVSILIFLPGRHEITTLLDLLEGSRCLRQDARGRAFEFLPLHASLSAQDQQRIFQYRPGVVRIIAATNIAETSLTIEDVTVVIDTGRVKQLTHDAQRRTNVLEEMWVARANATQRAGRAGRTHRGACFRLFPKTVFDRVMREQPVPEIQRAPLTSLCLQVLAFRGREATRASRCTEFVRACLDPPDADRIHDALEELVAVGALHRDDERLTTLGHHLARLPVDMKVGKVLLYGALLGVFEVASACAAVLETRSPFVSRVGAPSSEMHKARANFAVGASDVLTDVNAFQAWRDVVKRGERDDKFCRDHWLSLAALREVHQLQRHFRHLVTQLGFLPRQELPRDERMTLDDVATMSAVLYAGLAPNLVHVEACVASRVVLRERDRASIVVVHPSSINYKVATFPSKFLTYPVKLETSQVYLPVSSLVLPLALCLFSTTLEPRRPTEKDGKALLRVNEWVDLASSYRSSLLVQELRVVVHETIHAWLDAPPHAADAPDASTSEHRERDVLVHVLQRLFRAEFEERDANNLLSRHRGAGKPRERETGSACDGRLQ